MSFVVTGLSPEPFAHLFGQDQADLARRYGIHGFCYYHYWFNGKRLLERPFNEVVAFDPVNGKERWRYAPVQPGQQAAEGVVEQDRDGQQRDVRELAPDDQGGLDALVLPLQVVVAAARERQRQCNRNQYAQSLHSGLPSVAKTRAKSPRV